MRRRSCGGNRGLVDKSHNIVAISAIIDPRDPRWIWRAGESDWSDQYQCHEEGRKRGELHRTQCRPQCRRYVIQRMPQAPHSRTATLRMGGPYLGRTPLSRGGSRVSTRRASCGGPGRIRPPPMQFVMHRDHRGSVGLERMLLIQCGGVPLVSSSRREPRTATSCPLNR